MFVVNTETVPGFEVLEVKGIVQGNTVRAKHAGLGVRNGNRQGSPFGSR